MLDSKSLDSLRQEMFMILQLCWVEQRLDFKLALNPDIINGPDFLTIFYSIKVINNDIIIRLSKFYDKRKDTSSLYSIIKELEQTKRANLNPDLKIIKDEIEHFCRTEFINIKERRDEKLAHLKKGQSNTWHESSFVLSCVIKTLYFLDEINGKKLDYIWNDNRLNSAIDLRVIV